PISPASASPSASSSSTRTAAASGCRAPRGWGARSTCSCRSCRDRSRRA
ncbi:MAG: hypothetical protein AVDCRST_MAG40-554, partial [uncultured Gemmatimonadaceae bacterium]